MIVAESTNFVRFIRGYWKHFISVAVVWVGVEIANDYVSFDRRALAPTSIEADVVANRPSPLI
jgi:hypothetical protein